MRELSAKKPAGWARSRSERVAVLAEAQGGVVHRQQLLGLGLSATTISRWVAARRIFPIYPAVYAVGHRAISDKGRLHAALLHAGAGAGLSDLTGAWWWRVIEDHPPVIHLSAPGDVRSVPGLVVHHPRRLELVTHRGLPVTPVAQVLLDIAAKIPFGRLRRALAEAEYQRLVTVDEVSTVLGRGKPGSAALRRAIALHQPRLAHTRSVLEERFVSLCERHSIPLPEVNVYVCDLLVDALWRRERVVVELDGGVAHATPARMERDRDRDLRLREGGFVCSGTPGRR